MLFCYTPLLVRLTALRILILPGQFGLSSLLLFLTPLLPLLSLLGALLFLTLAFGLIRLPTLILGLTALLFGLASLLGFFVAPVFILILLVLLVLFRFPFFASQATVFTVTRLLGTGKTGGSQQSR